MLKAVEVGSDSLGSTKKTACEDHGELLAGVGSVTLAGQRGRLAVWPGKAILCVRNPEVRSMRDHKPWPSLDYVQWGETCAALHLWTQIVGKVRLRLSPWLNHSWHATLYVTARGVSTGPIVYGARAFEMEFNFLDHRLEIQVSDGQRDAIELQAMSVADFHRRLFEALTKVGVSVKIHQKPNEVETAVSFASDTQPRPYDPAAAHRFWQALLHTQRVFNQFRAEFIGKCSPVHLFWGSFDLAVTRFSGRTAPPHPGGIPNLPDWVTREAYSHEVSSAGFWPGGPTRPEALYYSYAYPTPEGYADEAVLPAQAAFDRALGEFVLPYEQLRSAEQPDMMLMNFLHSTYEAAANTGKWPRADVERRRSPDPPRSGDRARRSRPY